MLKIKLSLLFFHFFIISLSLAQHNLNEPDTIDVIKDTYARGGSYDDDNYGGEDEMQIKAGSTNSFLRTSFIQFDLSDYASVTSVRLQLYGSAQQTMNISAYKNTDTDWSESSLTWANKPTQGELVASTSINSTLTWVELDITSYAQSILNDNESQMSITLGDEEAINKTISIKSKEYDDGTYKARLIIEGELKTQSTIDVYLVIGQSNTAGRGDIEAQDEVVLENVFLLNDVNQWEQAENPLNAYSSIRKDLSEQGLGYAYTFSKKIQRVTGNDVGLVVNARGGSSIFSWRKGDDDAYFEEAYNRLQAALSLPNTSFKGILWHQGEANRNYSYYLSTLTNMINDWRDTLEIDNMPFVAGQLSQLRTDNEPFNQNILTLPSLVDYTAVVSSDDLHAPDLTHFDSQSQRILGERYADKILNLVYGITDIYAGKYYVDDVHGSDENTGFTEATAWKTLANVNNTTFLPGDELLFKSGGTWTGIMKPRGSGTENMPIRIGRYGNGEKPIIRGDGSASCSIDPSNTTYCTIHLANQEYWEISELEITNYDANEEGGISLEDWETKNSTDYANVILPDQYDGTNSDKCGILIEANDRGELKHLYFKKLEIHAVNGNIHDKDNGGIFIEVHDFGNDIPTYFNDILIDSCYIHDVDRTGVSNVSAYDTRTLTENTDWTASTNIKVSHTTFEKTGANALIIRVADAPRVEHCFFDHCAIKESGNAAFFFNTDNGIMQYNEFAFTKANVGDNDAGGPDIDFRTKSCTLQYNYLHDNDFGLLVTGGSDPTSGRFNDLGVVRYNIIERDGKLPHPSDGKFILKTSGNATRTVFHNNVILIDNTQTDTKIAWNKKWGGASSDQASYHNNIIYNLGINTHHDYGNSTNNSMSYNLYAGNVVTDATNETNKLIGDPFFKEIGNGPAGYEVTSQSDAIGAGLFLSTTPAVDYYGHDIDPTCNTVDIGVHQYQACGDDPFTATHSHSITESDNIFNIYPIPMSTTDVLHITSSLDGEIYIEITNASAKRIKYEEMKDNTIDLSSLAKGLYYLKVTQKNYTAMRKLIIK